MNLWKYRFAKTISTSQILTLGATKKTGRRVLMYHSIRDTDIDTDSSSIDAANIYVLSRSRFAQHVALLARHNTAGDRPVVPLESELETGVSITFDDGYKDTYSTAAPLLCQHNLPFHVFVTPANIISADKKYLNRDELRSLSQMSGVVIGGHGFSHLHLSSMSPERVREELRSSKEWLEDITGKPITTMSYPHGAFNLEVAEIAGSIGYLYAATSTWGSYTAGTNQLRIPRIDIWSFDTAKTLEQKLNGKWDWIRRFN